MAKAEDVQLLLMRGHIASLPDEDQAKVKAAREQIAALVESLGDHGLLGFALYGAEKAAEAK